MAEHKIDGNDGAGNVDLIEQSTKRQHFTDVRYVTVRWEPYKPDGARQMKAKGRWQEQVGTGDYFRWQNCDRPAFENDPETIEDLTAQLAAANARADKARDVALGEAARIADGYGPVACDTEMRDAILALRDKPAPAVTVQDAARVLADYIDSDMMKVNRMIDAMKRVSMETPARHWLSQVVRAIAGGD